MEIPEKLYLGEIERYFDDTDRPASTIKYADDDIEYTNTDAFIEKAVGWLKLQDEMVGISFQEDFIERFKNYMKR